MDNKIYVWDPLIRIFHWTLVLSFFIAYFTGEDESDIHIYSGYYIFGLIFVRIIWGFVGTKYARFSSFTFSPAAVWEELSNLNAGKRGKEYIGQNPAGSWMVIALLFSIFITGYSGLELYATEGNGPLAQYTDTHPTKSGSNEAFFIRSALADEKHDEKKSRNHHEDDEGDEFWEEIHEISANFTLLLAFLHIFGVAVTSKMHDQNLVRAMITGYKD